MATDIMGYANRHTARMRNRTSGGTSSIPVSGRHAPSLDIAGMMGKTAPKGGAGGLESRQIPAPIQEAGPEAMSVEGGEASMQPQMVTETQQPIENRGGSARYMIQGGGPKIDLSFLVPERANKEFNPSKAIGGENLPFQESKGVGGFFRRMLGDESNQQNIAAQQAQGAEWRQDAKDQKIEDRALNRMREGDKPQAERFNRQLEENKAIRGEESATRLRERGEDTATRKGEREQDRTDRLALQTMTEKARLQERQDRLDQYIQQNAQTDAQIGFAQTKLKQPNFQSVPDGKGGVVVIDETTGMPKGNFRASTLGEIQDPKYPKDPTKKIIGTVPGGWEDFAPKAKAPPNPNPGGSDGVDRGTGLLPGGGPLTTPTRSGISLGGALNEPAELPPGGGVRMGGALPAPMTQAAPAVVTQPRSATLADQLVNLPGMGAALDMGYYMTPERSARLEESKRQQQAESLKRTRAMQEQAYGDLGPSMY